MTQIFEGPGRGAAAQARARRGLAFLSRGFRPFFFAAGVWALLGMAVWPPFFTGQMTVPTALAPIDWHAHEMIFGYAGAVVAGFLLTAIPNWTGRPPVANFALAALAGLWAAGRAAVFISAVIGRIPAATIDAAFLIVFAAVAAREVIAAGNWRNVKVAGIVFVLGLANIAFHVEDASFGAAAYSTRAALGLLIVLILLIGGRVTPSFTGNWMAKMGIRGRPTLSTQGDAAAMGLSIAAVALWVALPEGPTTGAIALLAFLANLWRLSRWRGLAARRDALLLVLHVGFLFAALGFAAVAAHALAPETVPYGAGVHVWAAGAVGLMTLAMMTRATLGHSARALAATPGTQVAYACVIVAAVARVAMAMLPEYGIVLLNVAAGFWMLAFAAFLVVYAPLLLKQTGPG